MSESMNHNMPRRAFLGVAAGVGATQWAMRAISAQTGAASAAATQEGSTVKRCRYWMHGFGGEPKAAAQAFKDAGFDVVVAGGEAVIEAVRAAGMESWLCGGAFGVGKEDETLQAVDITGQRRIWFGSGCPNQAALRDRNLKSYESMAATAGIQGILVDGCRFASPASGLHPFLTCFCEGCAEKAGKLGFDFGRIKTDVAALRELLLDKGAGAKRRAAWFENPIGVIEWLTEHPGILDWLRFRRVCITEHFRNISAIIHGANLRLGVYIFTPSLSALVGQSYVDLAEFMDVFAPMIYRNYPDSAGEACLNWELTNIPEELGLIGDPAEMQAMDLILRWTGLDKAVTARRIKHVRAALPPEAAGHQTRMARALIGDKELAPIIYIDDPLMGQTADLVRQNGADGVNFFVYKEAWAEMVRDAIVK